MGSVESSAFEAGPKIRSSLHLCWVQLLFHPDITPKPPKNDFRNVTNPSVFTHASFTRTLGSEAQ